MRASEPPGKHLTSEEIVLRVFPVGEEPVPVPLHLAACTECQARIAKIREGLLMDRGAIDGMIEAIPPDFWQRQSAGIMDDVRAAAAEPQRVLPFRLKWNPSVVRRPALALGSLAAAVMLVATLTVFHYRSSGPEKAQATRNPAPAETWSAGLPTEKDQQDDDLLLSVERMLSQDTSYGILVPDDV